MTGTVTNGTGHIIFNGGGSTATAEINFSGNTAISGSLDITGGAKVGSYTLAPGSGSDTYFAWDSLVFPGSRSFVDATGLLFTGGGSEINLFANGSGGFSVLAGASPPIRPASPMAWPPGLSVRK